MNRRSALKIIPAIPVAGSSILKASLDLADKRDRVFAKMDKCIENWPLEVNGKEYMFMMDEQSYFLLISEIRNHKVLVSREDYNNANIGFGCLGKYRDLPIVVVQSWEPQRIVLSHIEQYYNNLYDMNFIPYCGVGGEAHSGKQLLEHLRSNL